MSLVDFESQSLADLGYRMPAEWEPHEGTWLSWPKKEETWPGKIQTVFPVFAEMIRLLSEGETVHVTVNDGDREAALRRYLKEMKADPSTLQIHQVPTNDSWMRDYGPIFVRAPHREQKLVAIDWGYNSWGGKYGPWDLDDVAPERIGEILSVPVVQGGMILEGGSIDVNGQGLLLTTEQCLLNENRNPQLSRADIEVRLKQFLGIKKVLWLGDGIVGDDTDGHIDDLTRFVSANTIVTIVEPNEKDENHPMLRDNLERLHELRNLEGGKFDIVELPMPDPVVYNDTRLPASYANFYIGNAVVLVPTYDTPRMDNRAVGILQELMPDRRVVGVRSTDLVWGLGSFHCVTQQQPRA